METAQECNENLSLAIQLGLAHWPAPEEVERVDKIKPTHPCWESVKNKILLLLYAAFPTHTNRTVGFPNESNFYRQNSSHDRDVIGAIAKGLPRLDVTELTDTGTVHIKINTEQAPGCIWTVFLTKVLGGLAGWGEPSSEEPSVFSSCCQLPCCNLMIKKDP